MAVEELLRYVHPDAVYHRVPLPDDQNALGPWREAIEHYVPPDKDDPLWGKLIYGAGEKGEPVAFPSGPEGDRLRALLDRNQTALALLEEGIHRGRLQVPIGQGDDALTLNFDFVRGIHDLGRMLGVKGKALLTDGDDVGAWRVRVHLLRFGKMLCNGEVVVAEYIMGHGFRRAALTRIREAASRGEIPHSILGELLCALEHSASSPDGLAQSLRVELCCWALPKIDRLPQDRNLEDFVDLLLEKKYAHGYVTVTESKEPQWVTPTDDRLAWRREQIISLLRGHPCPFEKIDTVRRLGTLVAARIHSLNYLRRPRLFEFGYALRRSLFFLHWRRCWRRPRGLRYWPEQFTPDFSPRWLGHGESARAALAELREHMGAKRRRSWQPPTEAEVAFCRRKLRRVRNPVGWMLGECLMSSDYRFCAAEYRSALEETMSLLTARLKSRS